MVDATTNPVQVVSCTTEYGSPCPSVAAPVAFDGYTGEAIIERPIGPPQEPLATYSATSGGAVSPVSIDFAAIDSSGYIRDLGSDDYWDVTLVNSSGATLEQPAVTGSETFTMTWKAAE